MCCERDTERKRCREKVSLERYTGKDYKEIGAV